MAGVLRDGPQRDAREFDGVLPAGAADDRDRGGADLAGRRVLHRRHARAKRLERIGLRRHRRERALEIPERVGSHPLDPEARLDLAREQVAERARAAELHVAVRILLASAEDRRSRRVADALRHRHDAAAQLVHHALHVRREARHVERPLRQVDQVRTVVGMPAPERGGRGEEAGVAAHDDVDLHAAERQVVEIVAHEGEGHEARRAAEAGRVVVLAKVVVDRLGDVEAAQVRAAAFRHRVHDVDRLGGVVAADVEEVADVALAQHLEDLQAVLLRGLAAHAAERRRGRGGDGLEVLRGDLAQIDELLGEDAVDAVDGAVDPADRFAPARRHHGADETLVDDHRGTAALGDDHVPLR